MAVAWMLMLPFIFWDIEVRTENLIIFFAGITSYFDSQGKVKEFFKIRTSILSVLVEVGMSPTPPKLVQAGPPEVVSVLLDGRIVGFLSSSVIEKVVAHLRRLKVSPVSGVRICSSCSCFLVSITSLDVVVDDIFQIPDDLEVGYVPLSMGGTYPGLYLFTSPSRFVRPVKNISIPSTEDQNIELIGPFEQVYIVF